MSLRAIASSMDLSVVDLIDARLEAVKRGENVAIPLAIESGSRAWGFPSPDSDYDCRFIYVRRSEDYLALFPKRDVIESPPDGELDINGWDVAKAVKLLLKGNAVVIEWLTSPIVYSANPWFRDEFLVLAERIADRALVARHYLHLGERQRRTLFSDGASVQLKKLFYALRPAAALRWLRLHPDATVAPMHFPTLLEECNAPQEVRALIDDLIVLKSATRELGSGPLPEPIAAFVDAEFARSRELFSSGRQTVSEQARNAAQAFFLNVLLRFGEPSIGR